MLESELFYFGGLLILASLSLAKPLAAVAARRPAPQANAVLFQSSGSPHGGEDFGGVEGKLIRATALLKAAYNAQKPEALFGIFTPFLKGEISLPALRSAFAEMRGELGEMIAIGAPHPAASRTAEMLANFDHGTMTVTLTIDPKGCIDGLLMEQS